MNKGIRDSPSSWLVQVPLSDLIALQNVAVDINSLRNENKQLLKRIEGLHRTLYETLEIVHELQKFVPGRRTA